MPLDYKPFDNIDEDDLQLLIKNQVSEGKKIEYKECLPSGLYEQRKEFLADLSSFANSSGGYLIFGMKEKSGKPIELCGIQKINPDSEILRLENIIRNNMEPRIPGISIRAIPLQKSGVAIVVRIPKSWALPHVVNIQKHWRFYSRTSAGKYPLDVSELRANFSLSESTSERIRKFRMERLGLIIAGETPVPLEKVPLVVLHIIPFTAFDPSFQIDLSSFYNNLDTPRPIISVTGPSHRYNFDGFLTFEKPPDKPYAFSYLQFFRNGSIEAVDTLLLRPMGGEYLIPSRDFEKELVSSIEKYLQNLKHLQVDPPVFVMLNLLRVYGYFMGANVSPALRIESRKIDRNDLIIPEVLLETYEVDIPEVLRPIFDAVWNAADWPQSMNYDENGKWRL